MIIIYKEYKKDVLLYLLKKNYINEILLLLLLLLKWKIYHHLF